MAARERRWRWRPHAPRIGIGWRLGLGLTAVAVVLTLGETLATRTARQAVTAVRSMQQEHEPLADRASAVLEQLVNYDRAVSEYVQAAREPARGDALAVAGDELQSAIAAYYDGRPAPQLSDAAAALRAQLLAHAANARVLAERAAQREQWVDERHVALENIYQRIVTAGGTGLAINGTQVLARRSLAELQAAIDAIRGNLGFAPDLARREQNFLRVLNAEAPELESSPGKAWLAVVRQDFERAARLRIAIMRYDETSAAQWHSLLEESAGLTAGVHELLEKPARSGLLRASAHAASAAEIAEHTLTDTGAEVLGLLLLVSVLLLTSISAPVRRLTVATRQLAAGDRSVRAPRGGSAEIDELAESFNTMAVALAHAEAELRAHQTELEQRVAERTRQLHHLAHHDPLTLLPNRRQMSARLTAALAGTGAAQQLALLFVDVDNFKSINDTLGHSFGDRVLQHVAAAPAHCHRRPRLPRAPRRG